GRLIELFSINPQRILKVKSWGLFEGSTADLTILDLNRNWTFDVHQSRSRSRNSPFHGWHFKGKATATIVDGKIAYQDLAVCVYSFDSWQRCRSCPSPGRDAHSNKSEISGGRRFHCRGS